MIRKVALPFILDSLPKEESVFKMVNAEEFSPLEMIDEGFDIDLKGTEIKDSKGKRLGKVVAHRNNMGIALIDLMRLNANGPNHEYNIDGLKSIMWQPVWMNVKLSGNAELTAAEQAS